MPTKASAGFTLIELLVVIVIMGILAAIAIPRFLTQANKAKQAEARMNVSSMNRAQQAFYLENTVFSTTVEQLGLGITTQTVNYRYSVTNRVEGEGGRISQTSITNIGLALKKPLRHYLGNVGLGTVIESREARISGTATLLILCESIKIRALKPNPNVLQIDATRRQCGTDFSPMQ